MTDERSRFSMTIFNAAPHPKVLNRWTCWFWTIINWFRSPFSPPVSAHEYVEMESHEGCFVSVLRCQCCDHLVICWNPGKDPRTAMCENPGEES